MPERAKYRVTYTSTETQPEHDMDIIEFETWLREVHRQPPGMAKNMAYRLQRRGILNVTNKLSAHYVKPDVGADP